MADLNTISAEVVRAFLAKGMTLGTAESLTGADENDIGSFVNVRIESADTYDLMGVKL